MCKFYIYAKSAPGENKEEVWLSPTGMTKALTSTEHSKKAKWLHKNANKNFDNTTIATQLRMVSWSDYSHPTGVVKTSSRDPNIPTNRKSCKSVFATHAHVWKKLWTKLDRLKSLILRRLIIVKNRSMNSCHVMLSGQDKYFFFRYIKVT